MCAWIPDEMRVDSSVDQGPPRNYISSQSRLPLPVTPWEWHNVAAMVLAGVFAFGQTVTWNEDAGTWSEILQLAQIRITQFVIKSAIILVFNTLITGWVVGTFIFSLVLMKKIRQSVKDPLAIRNSANWATWGLLLIGAGPFVALARINREKIRQRYYSGSNQSTFTSE